MAYVLWHLRNVIIEYSPVVDTFSSDYEDYFDEMGDDVLSAHGA